MKFFSIIGKAIAKAWGFCTTIFKICLIASIVMFILTIFMPDNVMKAIEIVRGLIS
jgi:predicted MFS family arabinose efflux permease